MGTISVATECVEVAERLGSTGAQQQALKLLTDDYDRLRRYLRGRVRTAENAEDVLHDFCLKVVTHSCGIQRSEAMGSWMTQVLGRTLIDHYRRSAADRRSADVLAKKRLELRNRETRDAGTDLRISSDRPAYDQAGVRGLDQTHRFPRRTAV